MGRDIVDLWISRKVACCAPEEEGIKKRNEKKRVDPYKGLIYLLKEGQPC